MSIDLADYRNKAKRAVKAFWRSRKIARERQSAGGRTDGNRQEKWTHIGKESGPTLGIVAFLQARTTS